MSDIQYVYPLIHNKVISPHYVTPTLRRARLIDWLNDAAECRAVVIAADAGYGKTTLLWQWEREVDFPVYWYKLDRNDRDWSLHISYMIEAISQRHPGFGRRAHSMLQQLGGPGSSRPGVAAYLLAEMYERLTEPCTFIIDDWQFVASVTEVRGLWNQILRDAPPTCRFIFLSRAKPHLQFARFKTHGGYAEMRTDALRFTDREIAELFRDIYNDPLDPTELAELEKRTEGWAASLQLVEVSLRERHTPEERRAFIQSITATRDNDLVEFLAEEVLDQQPPKIREFLLSTSVLQQINAELAGRLAGVEDGSAILRELEARGLFTYRLESQQDRYRYHGLFREFLERRLSIERTAGDVAALHIHAASFYETNSVWPDAIHHYMRAGLQAQAARLIARYGEDLLSGGRMPLVDEWLGQLPPRLTRDNARLSLLVGEVAGVRGDWDAALTALQRARAFFAKKGDSRMEALACSKLSTCYNNMGDVARCVEVAEEGLRLVPSDAFSTQIRLRGNVATTTTWLASLDAAERECKRLVVESTARGYEQYVAVAYHNLGVMMRYAGRLQEAEGYLERSARFWDASPTNPFADNSEYVEALLLAGQVEKARMTAEAAVARTEPWPRPHGEARYGLACVLAYEGRFDDAASILRACLDTGFASLGAVAQKIASLLVRCLYLDGGHVGEMRQLLDLLETMTADPRLTPDTSVAKALAAHRIGACSGHCESAMEVLGAWKANGAALVATMGQVPIALVMLDHSQEDVVAPASVLLQALDSPAASQLRWWFRRFAPYLTAIPLQEARGQLLARLIRLDPVFWVSACASVLPTLRGPARESVIEAIDSAAGPEAVTYLRRIEGSDVGELRRRLTQRYAERLYVRSFGSLSLHKGGWENSAIYVGKKRLKHLLGLMVANQINGVTRDEVLDVLWPESDPTSAINSLNQAVFQLRRLIEPGYREGESPPYIVSTVDVVQLNPALVETDLAEVRRISAALREPQGRSARSELARSLVSLVRGEFLADLKYEDWAIRTQLSVHAEIRTALLMVATGEGLEQDDDCVLRAGAALTTLDPYDEVAHAEIAKYLARSGRRGQAREFLERFIARLRSDLAEEPSDELSAVAALVGAGVRTRDLSLST